MMLKGVIIIKIGIVGTHGTGKSTLAKRLSEELKLPLIVEQVRDACKLLNIKNPDEVKDNPELFSAMQFTVLHKTIKEEEKHKEGFVADRTSLDNLAYYNFGTKDNLITRKTYEQLAIKNAEKYDVLIYVPIMFAVKDDEFRNTDEQFRKDIDFTLRSWYLNRDQKYIAEKTLLYTVKNDGLEERTKEVIEVIENIKNLKKELNRYNSIKTPC